MPHGRYKVAVAGAPVGQGVTGSFHVLMNGIAKKGTVGSPFVVANELICSSIARALLLPCPPGALIDLSGDPHFFSLDFNLAGAPLPPIDPAAVVAADPRLTWGVILFDILVANGDRHAHNMAFDQTSKRMQIFDHSHALFGISNDPLVAIAAARGKLAVLPKHCLVPMIDKEDGRQEWLDRIASLPDYFFEGLVEAGCQVGLPPGKKDDCVQFLKERRDTMPDLILSNLGDFKALKAVP